MEAHVERRFAIGPFASVDALCSIVIDPPPVNVGVAEWEFAPHSIITTAAGPWLCTTDPSVRDQAAIRLEGDYQVVTIDCWNAISEGATVARFRIEHHCGDNVEVEHADRRYPDLARAGMLPAVTADWLAQKVRGFARLRTAGAPSKKESEQRTRSETFVKCLIDAGAISMAPGSTITNVADRSRRILFVIARTRADAVAAILRMLEDSKHVVQGDADRSARAAAIRTALDVIRYRK